MLALTNKTCDLFLSAADHLLYFFLIFQFSAMFI